MSALIDYTLSATTAANPDSSHPAAFAGATPIGGPGATALGTYPDALILAAAGSPAATVDLTGLSPDRTRFTVDVVLRLDAVPTTPQPILSGALLPFALAAVPHSAGGYAIEADLALAVPGLAGARTHTPLAAGTWYTATLVYDIDTLAVYIDHVIESVHAYPAGAVAAAGAAGAATMTVAAGPIALAAIRWQDDIDPALETQLDDRRDGPEWALSYKREQLGAGFALGDAQGEPTQDTRTGAWVQHYAAGLIMWSEYTGAACEMHGDIWRTYLSLADATPLGVLVSDELAGAGPGSRRSTFTAGTIYWSPATGAVAVIGHLYADYERLGGPGGLLGMPTALSVAVSGGLMQTFEGGRMYYRSGAGAAHEVHGAILAQFLATGDVNAWGFPLTDEIDATAEGGTIGRMSEFDGATFYWSAATGAHEVHGDIRSYYRANRGAASDLGLPTSDERDIPGGSGRMNTFAGGSLLWYGSYPSIAWVHPFQLYIGRIDTVEDEGLFMGQNDVYGKVTLTQGGVTLYDRRQPASGDSDDHNVVDWAFTVSPTITPTLETVTLTIDLWDSDDGAPFGGGDDHLGTWHVDLTPANKWGLDIAGGIIDSGKFQDVNSVQVAVKPVVDVAALTPSQRWWGARNRGTDTIGYPLYAAAFADVDSDPEWSDPGDWLAKAYYAAVAEHIAEGGNCFGMSVAGIDALKGTGPFSLPLDRFTTWSALESQFNVRHQYQVGAGPIWWFVTEFLSGSTHSPKAVFARTREAYARGDNPVLCISQKSDFSGAPHCIMPVGWDDSSTPWRLMVQDPNFPASPPRPLLVDPRADTYHYDGGNVYDGASDGGGRMHWMPYHLLCHRQDTPIGEVLALLLAGTIIVLGAGADSAAITDPDGNDLDAAGTRAAGVLSHGAPLDGYFLSVKGSSSDLGHVGGRNPVRVSTAAAAGAVHGVGITQKVTDKVTDAIRGTVRVPIGEGIVVTPVRRIEDPIAGGLLLRPGQPIQDVVLTVRPRRVFVPPITTVDLTARPSGRTAPEPLDERTVTPAHRAALLTALQKDPQAARVVAARSPHNVLADPIASARLEPAVIAALRSQTAATGSDFVHRVTGTGADLDCTVRYGLAEIRVTSPLAAGERSEVTVTGLGTAKAVVGLTAATAKAASVRIDHRLGVGGDHLSIRFDRLPVGPGADLQVNVKPGIAGVDVLAGGAHLDVPVSIQGVIAGRPIGGQFSVRLDDGIRLAVSSMIDSGALRVGQIAALFAPASAVSVVAPL
ncbi:hypothetical protein GCM10022240_14010 [Microbacterium kribbense]|uniref:LGFP repeat-containing protein n=1 Tax=Microbacterium kribbense TaxID=433645 RepID=A0ABP7GDR7_9MICO